MNKQNMSNVISVNPGSSTLGQLYPESAATTLLKIAAKTTNVEAPSKKSVLNFCFASLAPGVNRFGAVMLLLRFAFGGIMIASGAYEGLSLYGIFQISVGVMMILGLFTRFATMVATVVYAALAIIGITHGEFLMQNYLATFAFTAFLALGSGKYSSDYLIRKSIIKKSSKKHKTIQPLTYRAFRQSI